MDTGDHHEGAVGLAVADHDLVGDADVVIQQAVAEQVALIFCLLAARLLRRRGLRVDVLAL